MAKTINIIAAVFLFFFFQNGQVFARSAALKKAETLILKDAYREGAGACRKILTGPGSSSVKARAHYLLGVCLLKEAGYAEARKNFHTILRRYWRSEFCDDAALGIADSYFLAADFEKAAREYRQFLSDFAHSGLCGLARTHLEQCRQGKQFANSYFSVQLGCFSKKGNARRMRDELINRGHQAYILELPGEKLYRVRAGKFNTRLQAEFMEQKLKSQGYSTKICP
jgi:tetratricopeptide (TPR) repeat protein